MDATTALNPAPGRATMSKSIELGLLGAGAILLAVLPGRVYRCAKSHDTGWGCSHSRRHSRARSHTGTDALTGAHGVGGC